MRTFRKLVIGIGLASTLALGITWGGLAPATQQAVRAELSAQSGRVLLELTPPVNIQKPGH